jgi:hypothetical protein
MKFRYPSERDMDNPWGWNWNSVVMSPGTSHYSRLRGGPLNSDVDSITITMAMSWSEENLDADGDTPVTSIPTHWN